MLTKTISYKDFNNESVTETFYFNINKTELLDNLDLRDHVMRLQTITDGDKRDLTEAETFDLLNLLRRMVRLSYGVRSEDGRNFRKSDEIWENFKSSAAHDELLFAVFTDPNEYTSFILGVLPPDLIKQVQEKPGQAPSEPTEIPAWERENRAPTTAEFFSMTPDEQKAAYLKRISNS